MRPHLCLFHVAITGPIALAPSAAPVAVAADPPNVLIVMADDCTHGDLPVHGGKNARTPHIDRLAEQGLVFERAYLAQAICQPCRSELYTGKFPFRNGSAWNHSASRPGITSLPHHLGKLGYRVGLSGKVHVLPESVYPFEQVGGYDPNSVRDPTQPHSTADVARFMRGEGPFCLVVALVEPHVPWVMGDDSAYPPKQLELPPNLVDTPVTRQAFASYLAEITYMDGQVGELLETLEATGKANDTLVLFTSEQGAQFPGNKWTNWDTGVHTSIVARWPGHVPAGTRTRSIVHYADVAPTLVELAGGDPAAQGYDGKSFRATLLDPETAHRDHAYGIHNNLPEGPPYPIRSVTDGEYRYIRNLAPGNLYIEKHLMGSTAQRHLHNPYWLTWMFATESDDDALRLVTRYMQRPAEQLYHTAKDPYELTNLADDPEHAEIKQRLSGELDRWLKEQGDPGAALDTREALEGMRRGKPKF